MTLELNATPEEVMRAVEALREFCEANQVAEKVSFGLMLALEECGSNIVNHALAHDPARRFTVKIKYLFDRITIELRDNGLEFDPTQAKVMPAATEPDERPPGGWGIELVRHYVDDISYAREAGENVLRLTKCVVPTWAAE